VCREVVGASDDDLQAYGVGMTTTAIALEAMSCRTLEVVIRQLLRCQAGRVRPDLNTSVHQGEAIHTRRLHLEVGKRQSTGAWAVSSSLPVVQPHDRARVR